MKKPGKVARFRIQRRFGTELPGLGKPGALDRRPYPPERMATNDVSSLITHCDWKKSKKSAFTMD